MRIAALLIVLMFVAVPAVARPHGDLEQRIAAVTKKIEAAPGDAKLFLERAELHRLHADWKSAHADIDRAFALQKDMPLAHYHRGATYLEEGRAAEALAEIDIYVAAAPDAADALITRARTLARLERWKDCADAYDLALQKVVQPAPDYYLGRADAAMRMTPPDAARAARGLEEGLAKCGPAITLRLKLIDCLAAGGKVDDALKVLDQVIDAAPRKETWQLKRGDVLAAANRKVEARAAYASALESIKKLSPRLQALVTTKEIARRAEEAIQKLEEVTK